MNNIPQNEKIKLEDLISIKRQLEKKQYKICNELNIIKKEIENIKQHIEHKCSHKWIIDPNYSPSPYEKPDRICTICDSIDYRW